uniref:Uncharacterized protein n=1 Tax=Acetithermum autotrophicum TaxID=1446466 RepID=H5ST80_ACEAU|nr:hypothetical protein HGMM_OP4C366 [Candidatus Acetothermum autotrophicum]
MLHKLARISYNKLSRRQVLRGLGVGMGMVAVGTLTGCTSGLVKRLETPGSKMAILSKEDRLAQAFAKLNKKLLKEAMDEMKAILKAHKRRAITERTAISRTRKVVEQVFDHYNRIGLTSALEENAYAALQAYTGLEPDVISYLRSAEVTEDKIQELRSRVQRARDELLPKASNLHLDQMMSNIITQLQMIESHQAASTTALKFEQLDFWKWVRCVGSALVTIGTGIATVAACASCASKPEPLSCAGCAGGALATLGAAALTAAECAGS